jgi:hypothetical protein
VRVVAIARTCQSDSTSLNSAYRDGSDHLGVARWIPIENLKNIKLIPSLRPVIKRYLDMKSGGIEDLSSGSEIW